MSTFIIRNKSTLEQWVADSGKRAWSKPAHAKNAFKGSSRNIPESIRVPHKDYRGNFHYDWLETPRFDDQDVFEIVELYSDAEKRSAEIERKFKEIIETFYGQNLYVANWHLNGDFESMDNFFEENDWFIEN